LGHLNKMVPIIKWWRRGREEKEEMHSRSRQKGSKVG
jgi:hypothetical protein